MTAVQNFYHEFKLSDLGEFRNGINFSKNETGIPYKLINVKDIFLDSPNINLQSLDIIELNKSKKTDNYKVQKDDIYFVRSSVKRDGVGYVARAERDDDNAVHCGFVIRFRVTEDKVLPAYLVYLLRSNEYRQRLVSGSGGSAITNISQEFLKDVPILLPNLDIQASVVEILSNYDNLIENNNRRIAILEEIAQSLYREWFVKFRFPGHQNIKLIDSPLGKIPKGWDIRPLNDLTNKIGSGATPKGGKAAYKPEGISLIRSMNVHDGQFEFKELAFIDEEQAGKLNNVIVENDDVLLNITGASVARCCLVPSFILPARVNQHVAIVRADKTKVSPFYIFNYLTSSHGKTRLLTLAQGGATREALTKSTIENFNVLIPPNKLLKKYDNLVYKTNRLKEKLTEKNNNLKSQRDLILPKLLLGNINKTT